MENIKLIYHDLNVKDSQAEIASTRAGLRMRTDSLFEILY